MKLSINWGTSIALIYSAFALSMVGVVFASRTHDPRLVQKNYYDLDLNYQAHLEKKQNAANLAVSPSATFDAGAQKIFVQFPPGDAQPSGTVKLFRSQSVKDDQLIPFAGHTNIEIPAVDLPAGRWHIALDWTEGGKSFYQETTVFIVHH